MTFAVCTHNCAKWTYHCLKEKNRWDFYLTVGCNVQLLLSQRELGAISGDLEVSIVTIGIPGFSGDLIGYDTQENKEFFIDSTAKLSI